MMTLTAVLSGLLSAAPVHAAGPAGQAVATGAIEILDVYPANLCGGSSRWQNSCEDIFGEFDDPTPEVAGAEYRLRSVPEIDSDLVRSGDGYFAVATKVDGEPVLQDGTTYVMTVEKYVGGELVATSDSYEYDFAYVDGPTPAESHLVQNDDGGDLDTSTGGTGVLVAGLPTSYRFDQPWEPGLVYSTRVVIASDQGDVESETDINLVADEVNTYLGKTGPAPIGFTPTAAHIGKYAFVSLIATDPSGVKYERYVQWGPYPIVESLPETSTPTGVRLDSAAAAERGKVKLIWNAVPGATSYEITTTRAGAEPQTTTVTSAKATVTGLPDDTTVSIAVVARQGDESSAPSAVLRVTTLGSKPVSALKDVPGSHVFRWEMTWLASTGVTTGYDDGTFRPGQPVLREQMAAFLYRVAGEPFVANLPAVSPFVDVPTSHVFYKEMVWLSRSGITTGYSDKTFRPSQPVLREQMAAFLFRLKKVQDGVDPIVPGGPSPFIDVASSHVFYGQMRWLASTGVTTGYDEPGGAKTFRPGQPVLREQMAAFLYRFGQIPVTEAP